MSGEGLSRVTMEWRLQEPKVSRGRPGRAFQAEGTARAGGQEGVYTRGLWRVACTVMGQFWGLFGDPA